MEEPIHVSVALCAPDRNETGPSGKAFIQTHLLDGPPERQ